MHSFRRNTMAVCYHLQLLLVTQHNTTEPQWSLSSQCPVYAHTLHCALQAQRAKQNTQRKEMWIIVNHCHPFLKPFLGFCFNSRFSFVSILLVCPFLSFPFPSLMCSVQFQFQFHFCSHCIARLQIVECVFCFHFILSILFAPLRSSIVIHSINQSICAVYLMCVFCVFSWQLELNRSELKWTELNQPCLEMVFPSSLCWDDHFLQGYMQTQSIQAFTCIQSFIHSFIPVLSSLPTDDDADDSGQD